METSKNSVNQSIRVRDTKKNNVASVVSLGRQRALRACLRVAQTLACGAALSGCSAQGTLGYYWQAAAGQMQMLSAAEPVQAQIANPALPLALRTRLERTQQMRRYASTRLGLPDNASYRRYADLGRPNAVWNVVAAPADQLKLHNWCFPVVGCVGYRGYFHEADARAQAELLRQQGWEVSVYGVPAYSTLGWFNWLGGDPLLSTFIRWPEPEVAALLFHELAHQLIYVADDTAFNESFATAVQRLGSRQWLEDAGTPALRTAAALGEQRRQQWRTLTRTTRAQLAQLYAEHAATPLAPDALEARKQAVLQDFRQRYTRLRQQWSAKWTAQQAAAPQAPVAAALATGALTAQGTPTSDPWVQTDAWVAGANNASFAALGVYEDWTPAFEALFQQHAGDWPRFYDAVRALAAQPTAQRHAALAALLPPASH